MKKTAIILTITVLIIAILGTAIYVTQTATPNQLPAGTPPNWQIKITGDTENPRSWVINDIIKMPLTEVVVKSENATYRGVSISNFCNQTGARWDAGAITIIGESGQNATLNIYQAWNSTTYAYNRQYNSIVLAFIKNGEWLSSQDGGPVKLIAPSFDSNYQIGQVSEVNSQPWIVRVTGNVANPISLTGESLTAFQPQTVHGEFRPGGDPNRTSDWTGIPILDLINAAHPTGNITKVTVVGVDNYTKTFALAQVKAGEMMLGYRENSQSLPVSEGGPFRLFAPTDTYKWGQYWVKYVVEIRVE